jgi:hypothetical protein
MLTFFLFYFSGLLLTVFICVRIAKLDFADSDEILLTVLASMFWPFALAAAAGYWFFKGLFWLFKEKPKKKKKQKQKKKTPSPTEILAEMVALDLLKLEFDEEIGYSDAIRGYWKVEIKTKKYSISLKEYSSSYKLTCQVGSVFFSSPAPETEIIKKALDKARELKKEKERQEAEQKRQTQACDELSKWTTGEK